VSQGARISALYVYPVKSCRGIRVEHARVVRRGFEHDRRWMVVDDDGQFLTQRQLPALCRIRTSLEPEGIELATEGRRPYLLPLEQEHGEEAQVTVWGHETPAVRHAQASRWLSEAVGHSCSLVFMPNRHERAVDPRRAKPGDIVSFADGYPFLLISEASLSDLNSRLATPLQMERFRPNIVITGSSAFAEDEWDRLTLGQLEFRGAKRCDRCVVTTLDPLTGEAGKEPLRTLAKYRRSEGKVWFGMNLIHDGEGSLSVGDAACSL
jgi:uncharacterized protein YcbX